MKKVKIEILKTDKIGNEKGDVKEVSSNIASGMIKRKAAKVFVEKE